MSHIPHCWKSHVAAQCAQYAVNCKIELVIKVLNNYHNYSVVPRSRFLGNTNLNFTRIFANSGGHTKSIQFLPVKLIAVSSNNFGKFLFVFYSNLSLMSMVLAGEGVEMTVQ